MTDLDDPYLAQQILDTRTLSMEKVLKLASLEQEFLIHGAIPSRAVSFVVGTPGAKKSWLAYDMAIAISRGRPWLGLPPTQSGLKTLVLNYDNPTVELARRFLRLGALPSDPIVFHTLTGGSDLLRLPGSEAELTTIVRAIMPSLIVVDSLRQSHMGDESNSREMAQVMAIFRSWTQWGASVVILHHTRKAPTDPGAVALAMESLRGSTEIAASADAIIAVSIDSDGDGDITNKAMWVKTRGWAMPHGSESLAFDVTDAGNSTKVEKL